MSNITKLDTSKPVSILWSPRPSSNANWRILAPQGHVSQALIVRLAERRSECSQEHAETYVGRAEGDSRPIEFVEVFVGSTSWGVHTLAEYQSLQLEMSTGDYSVHHTVPVYRGSTGTNRKKPILDKSVTRTRKWNAVSALNEMKGAK
jgi:hypothetical protein